MLVVLLQLYVCIYHATIFLVIMNIFCKISNILYMDNNLNIVWVLKYFFVC